METRLFFCIENRLVVSTGGIAPEVLALLDLRSAAGGDECLVVPLSGGPAEWRPLTVLQDAVTLDQCFVPWVVPSPAPVWNVARDWA